MEVLLTCWIINICKLDKHWRGRWLHTYPSGIWTFPQICTIWTFFFYQENLQGLDPLLDDWLFVHPIIPPPLSSCRSTQDLSSNWLSLMKDVVCTRIWWNQMFLHLVEGDSISPISLRSSPNVIGEFWCRNRIQVFLFIHCLELASRFIDDQYIIAGRRAMQIWICRTNISSPSTHTALPSKESIPPVSQSVSRSVSPQWEFPLLLLAQHLLLTPTPHLPHPSSLIPNPTTRLLQTQS